MQDLNNLPTTPEEDEAMDALAKLGGGVDLKEMFTQMGQDLTGKVPVLNISDGGRTVQYQSAPLQHAPEPQPTLCESTQTPTLTDIVNNICTQLQLLSTVIGEQARNTTPPEGNQSLQECVSLTLQQADWFKEMVRGIVDDTYDFADYAKDAVQDVVESEVESYFENSFDPSNHFDFDDAVHDAVGDRIDDVVSDKIDDAVDSYLSNATITISK
jgi:hypothetical protein